MLHNLDGQRLRHAMGRAVACAVVLLLAGACRGDDRRRPPPCLELDFRNAMFTAAAGDVFLERAAASCSTVEVSVMVADLTGIWTVGFDLEFPSTLIRYDGYVMGPLLLKGAPLNPPVVLVNETGSRLQVTLSRLQPDPSVDAVGREELIRFRFMRLASGAGVIDFDSSPTSPVSEAIFDENGNARPASFGPGHGGLVTVP
ncbi:MAG: hypothetical protein HY510_02485 [Acidobacteria bacterium]|nr:hypothetical protein [Acidobacteriota bacterium]